ncbi:MAG: thiamine pyrophosphate-dependent enzyme [Dehalococcoidia bacterium]|jgi:thiamine pyrophosphate-dependent acetolactate synthase large subunit-like protein|nr:thiamine pyrophosphate-dependent enzyme [Dehalococcoidia bacterium]
MINSDDVFRVFEPHRGKAIVTTSGTAGRKWPQTSNNPERDVSMGSAMGQTTSAAFGLALGLPDEKIVLFDSEGAMLMNLGVLASIAGKKPKNFVHFLLDNEVYATTGGQPVPNNKGIDYAGMAKAIGYASTHHFDDLEDFATKIESIMSEEGPVFISIKIDAEVQNMPVGMRDMTPARPRPQTIKELRAELGITA